MSNSKTEVIRAIAVIVAAEIMLWVIYGIISDQVLGSLEKIWQVVVDEFIAGLFLIPMLLIAVRWYRMKWSELGIQPTQLLRNTIIGLTIGTTLVIISVPLERFLTPFFPDTQLTEFDFVQIYRSAEGPSKVFLFFGYACITPVSEEVLYRGIMFGLFRRALSLTGSVLASAIVFAVFHVVPTAVIITFFVGCVLAIVRERTGSIEAPILAHLTNNAAVLLF
jgi:uncharacterized protein